MQTGGTRHVYSWDPVGRIWVTTPSEHSPSAHSYVTALDSSGMYGVLEMIPTTDTIFAETTVVYRPYVGKQHCTVRLGHVESTRYGGVLIRSRDSITAAMDSAVRDLRLTRAPMTFDVHFPDEWPKTEGHGLTLGLDSLNAVAFFGDGTAPPPHFVLYGWNSASGAWRGIRTVFAQGRFFEWSGTIDTSGTYIVAQPGRMSTKLFVYPNPARIRGDRSIAFEGHGLTKVWIYGMDGELVSYFDAAGAKPTTGWAKESDYTLRWRLRNSGGNGVPPGTYLTIVGVNDYTSSNLVMRKRKIMLIP